MEVYVARAQAGTLREWAEVYEREARAGDGRGEVAFLMRRAARMIESIAAGDPILAEHKPMERESEIATEPREG